MGCKHSSRAAEPEAPPALDAATRFALKAEPCHVSAAPESVCGISSEGSSPAASINKPARTSVGDLHREVSSGSTCGCSSSAFAVPDGRPPTHPPRTRRDSTSQTSPQDVATASVAVETDVPPESEFICDAASSPVVTPPAATLCSDAAGGSTPRCHPAVDAAAQAASSSSAASSTDGASSGASSPEVAEVSPPAMTTVASASPATEDTVPVAADAAAVARPQAAAVAPPPTDVGAALVVNPEGDAPAAPLGGLGACDAGFGGARVADLEAEERRRMENQFVYATDLLLLELESHLTTTLQSRGLMRCERPFTVRAQLRTHLEGLQRIREGLWGARPHTPKGPSQHSGTHRVTPSDTAKTVHRRGGSLRVLPLIDPDMANDVPLKATSLRVLPTIDDDLLDTRPAAARPPLPSRSSSTLPQDKPKPMAKRSPFARSATADGPLPAPVPMPLSSLGAKGHGTLRADSPMARGRRSNDRPPQARRMSPQESRGRRSDSSSKLPAARAPTPPAPSRAATPPRRASTPHTRGTPQPRGPTPPPRGHHQASTPDMRPPSPTSLPPAAVGTPAKGEGPAAPPRFRFFGHAGTQGEFDGDGPHGRMRRALQSPAMQPRHMHQPVVRGPVYARGIADPFVKFDLHRALGDDDDLEATLPVSRASSSSSMKSLSSGRSRRQRFGGLRPCEPEQVSAPVRTTDADGEYVPISFFKCRRMLGPEEQETLLATLPTAEARYAAHILSGTFDLDEVVDALQATGHDYGEAHHLLDVQRLAAWEEDARRHVAREAAAAWQTFRRQRTVGFNLKNDTLHYDPSEGAVSPGREKEKEGDKEKEKEKEKEKPTKEKPTPKAAAPRQGAKQAKPQAGTSAKKQLVRRLSGQR